MRSCEPEEALKFKVKHYGKRCIDKIEQKASQIQQDTGNSITVKYAVISFGEGATLLTNGFVSAETAKSKIDTSFYSDSKNAFESVKQKLKTNEPIGNFATAAENYEYLLKEYNRRWYLFAAAEDDEKMLCFGLDRIDKVVPLPSHKYVEYNGDLNERFEDIIGVTLFEDSPLYKIIFWVSDFSKDYVKTKPIHESQRSVNGNKETVLRSQYPNVEGGMYFRIDCKENYELIRELCSFGKNLIVLEPSEIREKIFKRISEMNDEYVNLRT